MLQAELSAGVASFDFLAFGLRIAANRLVPGLEAAAGFAAPDLRIWFGLVPPPFRNGLSEVCGSSSTGREPDKVSEAWVTVWKHEGYYQLRYADHTEFFIDKSGSEVWATWPSELTLADTATYLLGPVINVVLRLRGTFTLHASAVRIGNKAVAFVGPQGAGKSTTAATFAMAGYPVLTDDAAALEDRGQRFRVLPAYPRVRLWPSSVELLFGSGEALPRLTPGWNKRYLQLEGGPHPFQHEPVPLGAIYFLHPRASDAAGPVIDDEPERDAMIKLIGNVGGNYLLGEIAPEQPFDLLQRIIRFVPMRRLVPNSGVRSLAQLREAVVSDLASLPALAS
jgi:hypothetical protein